MRQICICRYRSHLPTGSCIYQFIRSVAHTAVSPPHMSLQCDCTRPPLSCLAALSQGLTDLYLPARSVISRTLMVLSAACCLSADGLRLTHATLSAPAADVGQPRQLFSTSTAAAVRVEGLTRCCWSDELNRTLTPRLSLWRSSLFSCRLCCFWLRLSNRFPVGMTMAGGKEEASALADLGLHKNKPVTFHPSCWRGGELPSGFEHGLLLSRGGCDERAAVGKQYIQLCCSSEINKPFFTSEFYSD